MTQFFSSVLLPCYNVIYNDVDDTLDLTHIYIHTYVHDKHNEYWPGEQCGGLHTALI